MDLIRRTRQLLGMRPDVEVKDNESGGKTYKAEVSSHAKEIDSSK